MKKMITAGVLGFSLLSAVNVYACGEISNLTSNIGTVTSTNITNYVVTVPEGTNTVVLSADTEYDWVTNYAPREVSTAGKVELRVDGNKCGYGIYTYFITFNKVSNLIAENTPTDNNTDADASNNANTDSDTTDENTKTENTAFLSNLEISGYEITFVKNISSYKLSVPSTVESLKITATPEVEGNTVTISDEALNLVNGDNTIKINVVDANGNTGTYTLLVTREKQLSTNNYLASIVVKNYSVNFNSSITDYYLSIGKETSLDITAITESTLATSEIIGNKNLSGNGTVTVRVTAENGDTKDYILHITRAFNISDYYIYIAIVALVLILVILLIIRNKQKKKKKITPEEIKTAEITAGSIESSSPNAATSNQTESVAKVVQNENAAPVKLQMLSPTNVEVPEPTTVVSNVTEETLENTEVFKL